MRKCVMEKLFCFFLTSIRGKSTGFFLPRFRPLSSRDGEQERLAGQFASVVISILTGYRSILTLCQTMIGRMPYHDD